MFEPNYQITAPVSKSLMRIEAVRQAITELPVNVAMLASLRETAKLVATHYSTQIEGNHLTQAQVEQAISGAHFPGRERDESEVRNYYRALDEAEKLAALPEPITEESIQRLHGLVIDGRSYLSPYRTAQNVIRDSASGDIVYMPPEAKDVSELMGDLTTWLRVQMNSNELPAPVIAALAHYQYATIHPYYDGNGRTARLLTTIVLHKMGYGLKGIYSLEEYYAQNLGAYYGALSVGPSHNYYLGRAEADVTAFVAYFCQGMASSFDAVKLKADRALSRGSIDQSAALRLLGPRERRLLTLFRDRGVVTTVEIASHLELSPRTVTALTRDWIKSGFLELHDPSRKNRAYRLSPELESLVSERNVR